MTTKIRKKHTHSKPSQRTIHTLKTDLLLMTHTFKHLYKALRLPKTRDSF